MDFGLRRLRVVQLNPKSKIHNSFGGRIGGWPHFGNGALLESRDTGGFGFALSHVLLVLWRAAFTRFCPDGIRVLQSLFLCCS